MMLINIGVCFSKRNMYNNDGQCYVRILYEKVVNFKESWEMFLNLNVFEFE